MNENNRFTKIQPIYFKEIPSLEQVLDSIRESSPEPDRKNIENKEPQKNIDPRKNKNASLLREFISLSVKIAVIAGIAAAIFNFVYGLHYNIEPGMNPAIKDGDLVMYYRWNKNYRADDLIVLTFQGKKQVRRVVAMSGDTVDITKEGLFINGALQHEPGIYQETIRYADGIEFPVTLGEGQVFVLGDARANATDSRIYGPVNVQNTHGTVITTLRRRNL